MTVKAAQFKNSQRLKDFQLAIKSTLWGGKKGKKSGSSLPERHEAGFDLQAEI